MSRTFVIAEAAMTWRYGDEFATALQSIGRAKQAGADAWKTQWTSDPKAMAERRKMSGADYSRLAWPPSWHDRLARLCHDVGLEYIVTVFLARDIPVIGPYVNRFKVSAFESGDAEFMDAHAPFEKEVIASENPGKATFYERVHRVKRLYCVSEYPTPISRLGLGRFNGDDYDGFSDHTIALITGAAAVARGATIIEKHFRLPRTPASDLDYRHSLEPDHLSEYIDNIREAEAML